MNRWYDIFEVLPDGALMWKMTIDGHEQAIRKIEEMAAGKTNEFRLLHLPTQTTVIVIEPKTS